MAPEPGIDHERGTVLITSSIALEMKTKQA